VIGTESCTELINAQACVNAYAGVCSEVRLTFLNPGSPAWIGLSMRV